MQVNPAYSKEYDVVSNHQFAEIRKDRVTGQQTLFSLKDFKQGEQISPLGAAFVTDKPSYLTVQTGNHTHIALHPYFLQYINHGCNPNCFFDTTRMKVTALRDIKAGEEFTFFYPSTEWEMASPFQCYCNQPNCLGYISGAAHLSAAILKKYTLSDFIKRKLQYKLRKLKRA
jgi:hypothetical protein